MLIYGELTEQIIGSAIEVHRLIGPGVLESVYEDCLCYELDLRGIPYLRNVDVSVTYKGRDFGRGFSVELVVADAVVVDLKAIELVPAVHVTRLVTYMRFLGKRVGLIINFHAAVLKDGIVRRVL